MRPITLALGGPDLASIVGPFAQSVMPGIAQASAPFAREVTRDAIQEAQPLVNETARTAAREVWSSVPRYAIVGGAVAVGALVLIAVRGVVR